MSAHDRDPNCIVCKSIAGEIPSARVLDTAEAYAFLDIHPVNRGHVLIVPKAHFPNLAALPDNLAAHVASHLPRLCRAVKAATGADALNVIVNNGAAAGQTVDHVHWHVIPRFPDDAVHWPWPHQAYEGEALNRMKLAIESELNSGS